MRTLKTFFTLSIFVCLLYSVNAQDSSTSKISYFKASVSYLTNSVYNGRKDSAVLPYVTPSLGYYNKSGFFALGSLSYSLASGDSRVDHFTLEAGYEAKLSSQVNAGFYGSKYFYNNSSTDVRSEMKGGLGGNLSYEPGFVTFSVGADLSFASHTDIDISGALSHGFYFGEKGSEWAIVPTVTTHLGTQNYYQDYINFRKGKGAIRGRGRGRNGSGGATTTMTTTVASSKFGILDYEFSVPIEYDGNKWGLFLTPIYAIPQNPVSVSSSATGSTYITEKLENSFYTTVGVYLKF
ncbi:MAG: hypothetical protein NVS3B19_03870 [Ginsengibacter sp.]